MTTPIKTHFPNNGSITKKVIYWFFCRQNWQLYQEFRGFQPFFHYSKSAFLDGQKRRKWFEKPSTKVSRRLDMVRKPVPLLASRKVISTIFRNRKENGVSLRVCPPRKYLFSQVTYASHLEKLPLPTGRAVDILAISWRPVGKSQRKMTRHAGFPLSFRERDRIEPFEKKKDSGKLPIVLASFPINQEKKYRILFTIRFLTVQTLSSIY